MLTFMCHNNTTHAKTRTEAARLFPLVHKQTTLHNNPVYMAIHRELLLFPQKTSCLLTPIKFNRNYYNQAIIL